MKKRSMLRCISVLLCAVLCCPLFACAAAEDTDRTLFDNTDYILDVSEIVTSAMLLGGLPDRNELKIYELPGERASVLFTVYCRDGVEVAVLFRYYEYLSDLFWGKRTYYDGKVTQIEDAPEYGKGMKRLQVHMQGGFQDPDDYPSEISPSIWIPPQGGVHEFDCEFIVDAEDHIISLCGIRELGTEDPISFGYDGDRITEIRMNTTMRTRMVNTCFFSSIFLMILSLSRSRVSVEELASTRLDRVGMDAESTRITITPSSKGERVSSMVGTTESNPFAAISIRSEYSLPNPPRK